MAKVKLWFYEIYDFDATVRQLERKTNTIFGDIHKIGMIQS